MHSTHHAALELIDYATKEIDQNSAAVSIFLDLSKAFDTIDHSILLNKLRYYGVSNTELTWFQNYLGNRTQYVEIDGFASDVLGIKTGVPQGSILGPLLFLIYINDLPVCSQFFKFIIYADDTSLFSSLNIADQGVSIQDVIANLNIELHKVSTWMALNKLSLNISKSKYMVFHSKYKKINDNFSVYIDDVRIDRVSNFDFLGVVINENLSWKPHTDKIANKVSKYMGVLCRLRRYLPPHILRSIYCSMIQSQFNYSILVWGYEAHRISKLQKKIIRVISNAKYNAHTDPLYKSHFLLKVEDIFTLSCLDFYYRFSHGTLPAYFQKFNFRRSTDTHSYNTRQNNRLVSNITRTQLGQRCLRNGIISVINSTDSDIIEKIQTHSLQSYKNIIKKRLIDLYDEECYLVSCYICNRT